jgi:hypothetical protein
MFLRALAANITPSLITFHRPRRPNIDTILQSANMLKVGPHNTNSVHSYFLETI